MYVACSTLCFSRLTLEEALRTIREKQFSKADLAIHDGSPHLTPAEVAADIGKVATRLKASNQPFAAFHAVIGSSDPDERRLQLRAVCRLARMLTVPVVTVPAAPLGSDFDAEIARLRDWSKVATSEGVILSVETHSATVTADPIGAGELCRRVPGLGLTLDPSHYHVGPHGGVNYDSLFTHVRHVQLRDTGATSELFQVRIGQGELEFGRIISQLERVRYDRALSVDIRDQKESPFPIEPEVRKLKFLLESLG